MKKFRVINPDYEISYDKTIIDDLRFKNLDVVLSCFLCNPPKSKNEGLYYRIIKSKHGTCIQCIAFWHRQWFPYHIHDYHPFYIYLDDDKHVKFILIDDGHHYSKKIFIDKKKLGSSIRISFFLPDHGLTDRLNFGRVFKPNFIPLKPRQIINWWVINNMAQLKLRTKLVDPYKDGLIPENIPKQDSLIYRLNHISNFNLIARSENTLRYTFRDEVVCPVCNQLINSLDFIPVHKDQKSNHLYLKKEMKCKNGHQFIIKYNFQKAKIEYID
ncbi:MAG: hypothetical protein EU550_03120 [Promethearchaeota archaeon]|nr:MAG: hypothetical protein EU550_03120 [Candidatus Lokiarchaeota archaeon]